MLKRILATASAVALSLAMVALPALPAAADDADPSLTQTQPSDTPPAEDPPAEDPPADDPPADDPPADDPPAEDPPADDPPAEGQTFSSSARNSVAVDCDIEDPECGADEVLVLWDSEDQVCNESVTKGLPGLLTGGVIDIDLYDSEDVASVSYTFEGGVAVPVTVTDHIHLSGLAPGDYVFTLVPVADHTLSTDEIKIKIKPDHNSECQKVTICHWEPAQGGKYTNNSVSVESIINLPNGHKYHPNDLIPAFYYGPNGTDYFPGMPVDQGALPDCDGDPGTEVVFVNEDHDPQTCVVGEGDDPDVLLGGVIELEVDPSAGVEKIEYRVKGIGAWVEVDLNTLTVTGLAPNTYEFKVTVAEGYEIDEATFDVTIGKYTGVDCFDLVTHPPVTPLVNVTPGTCTVNGSFELISPEPEEGLSSKTVTWYVNDVETDAGTYPLEAGEVVIVKVVANGPDYSLELEPPIDSTPEYTYDPISYDGPTNCQLTTLALTGSSGTTPLLWLAGFLGLLGVALVRSARHLPQPQKA